jgi:hypothetical protein
MNRGVLAWEDRAQPMLEAFWATLQELVLNPMGAFARMPVTGGLGRPVGWLIIIGWFSIIVSQLWGLLFQGVFSLPLMDEMEAAVNLGFSAVMTVIIMVVAPLLVLIGLAIQSLVLHLMLILVDGARNGLEATVRVCCYAGTAQLASVVPFCGGLIGLVWSVVLLIIGLAAAHRIDHGRAAIAVFLPVVLCCVCAAAMVFLTGLLSLGLSQ